MIGINDWAFKFFPLNLATQKLQEFDTENVLFTFQ